MLQSLVFLAAAALATACGEPPPSPPPQAGAPIAVGPPGAVAKPVAPAFKAGMVVGDRTGARVGEIQSVVETPGGLNVVVKIDGKLVGVSPSTLQLRGESAVSSQTKEEMLAMAEASR